MEVTAVRQDAKDIFDAAVSAVYPPQMIRNAVQLKDDGKVLLENSSVYGFLTDPVFPHQP